MISPNQAIPCWGLGFLPFSFVCTEETRNKDFTACSQDFGQKRILKVLVGRKLEPDFTSSCFSDQTFLEGLPWSDTSRRVLRYPHITLFVYFLRSSLWQADINLFLRLLVYCLQLRHNLHKKNPVLFHLSHLQFWCIVGTAINIVNE